MNKKRSNKNKFTTRSGKTIKVNKGIGNRLKAHKNNKALRKAERMNGLPKGRLKRFIHRLHPKRMYAYWFSRDGAVMALKIMGVAFVVGFLFMVGLFAYFRKDLPNLRDISGDNIGGSVRYYDRTGDVLLFEDFDAIQRIPIESDEMSDNIKNATIAIEDSSFYEHRGFDVRGITRAAYTNIRGRATEQGGSTITQQLVKLTQNWTEERTYTRKIKELILAVELERSFTKEEILTGYLNTAPYGGIEYGVEAASNTYFHKPASDLTIDEAAMLAAIPQSPSSLSPYSQNFDKSEFIGRQHYIIDLMYDQNMITAGEREEAKDRDTLATVQPRRPKYEGIQAPWFVLSAKNQLEEEIIGGETANIGGWKVRTTLDMELQQEAEEQVTAGIHQVRAQGGDNIAFAAEDVETGQMVALVGGVDFDDERFGQNNYAQLRLPPGSSIKPYNYAAVIEKNDNFGAGTVLYDEQHELPGYPCTNRSRGPDGNCLRNFDHRYPGPLTLRYALGGSRNVPAVKAMLIAGIDETIDLAQQMGLRSGYNCYADDELTQEAQCFASAGIGDGAYLRLDEHTHALGTFSRNGRSIPQTYILDIKDSKDQQVYEWEQEEGDQVIRPDTAYIINDMLADADASYMSANAGAHNYNGWRFAAKTGTTNDRKDGWMTGYSSKYSASVWVGYHSREREMSGVMETMTRPIWTGWMHAAHEGKEPQDWERPDGVQEDEAFVIRNDVGLSAVVPSPETDLFPSWYENPNDTDQSERTIDIVSNRLATECTPERARREVRQTDASSFSGDIFVDGGDVNSNQRSDVHDCSDSKPSVSLSVNETSNGYNLVATVGQGTHPISSDDFPGEVIFKFDGEELPGGTFTINSPGTTTYRNFRPDSSGRITVTVVDSVLYDASASRNVSAVNGGSVSNVRARIRGDDTVSVNWSGSGTFEVCYDGPASNCINKTETRHDFDFSNNPSGQYTITVRSGGSSDSDTIDWQ